MKYKKQQALCPKCEQIQYNCDGGLSPGHRNMITNSIASLNQFILLLHVLYIKGESVKY